jgi:hypothetical protein
VDETLEAARRLRGRGDSGVPGSGMYLERMHSRAGRRGHPSARMTDAGLGHFQFPRFVDRALLELCKPGRSARPLWLRSASSEAPGILEGSRSRLARFWKSGGQSAWAAQWATAMASSASSPQTSRRTVTASPPVTRQRALSRRRRSASGMVSRSGASVVEIQRRRRPSRT